MKMKHAKLKQHKPWKEEHQMVLTVGTFVVLVALGIAAMGYWFPVDPSSASAPAKAAQALR